MTCAVLVAMLGVVLLGIAVVVAIGRNDRQIDRDEHEDGGP